MVDFLSHFGSSASFEPVQHFGQVRISQRPALVRLLDAVPEKVKVHWVDGEPRIGWTPCPGLGCPMCSLGDSPRTWTLLLTVNLEAREAQVLGVPESNAPASLRSALVPHLASDHSKQFLEISRNDRGRHHVCARSLPPAPDDCADVADEALATVRSGVRLQTAFPTYSADDLAEIPDIARRARLRGLDLKGEPDDEGA